jgi:PKD repeat protein
MANPSHAYQSDGTYVARLTVSDGINTTTSSDLSVRVGNQSPVAVANATPATGVSPLTVTFSSTGSLDPEGAPVTYAWTFGDGGTSTSANPSHSYQAPGAYVAKLTVSDGVKTTSSSNLVISAMDPASSLVAAYGFEEGTGASVTDASGNANNGAISGATWTTSGRFGKALAFNGTDALVTVNDSASLDLTTGLTLEAWVNPTTLGSSWRDIIYKEADVYFLMGSTPQGPPDMGGLFTSANVYGLTGLPLNTWTHLAGTYDGTTMRFYVNGVQVSSRAQTGAITPTTGPLTIGGDGVTHDAGPQFWSGLIDEVRIYNRGLSASEIQKDMNTPVIASSTPAPPQNLRLMP